MIAAMHNPSDSLVPTYTLSSNPPNPKTSFRTNDWICASVICGAHNFARNATCFNCRTPRASQLVPESYAPAARLPVSPRFAGPTFTDAPESRRPPPLSRIILPVVSPARSLPPTPTYPLLTPSGRTFAVGGHVQNISLDPKNPICLFWPSNEPFPQPGQLRPPLHVVTLPPIMNTGAKGPIEHQPGDWVCTVCQYLNWRRRKICQACFPYGEGNGDSISQSVQAERVTLLTNALTSTALPALPSSPYPRGYPSPLSKEMPMRQATLTPPPARAGSTAFYGPGRPAPIAVTRARSQFDLRSGYAARGTPIYQTSSRPLHRVASNHHLNARSLPPSPLTDSMPMSSGMMPYGPTMSERAHLPSFLSEIIASPALSASSSTGLSSLEDLTLSSPIHSHQDLPHTPNAIKNIWGFDGEERRALQQHLRTRRSQDALIVRQ